jgi:hypothetical protein
VSVAATIVIAATAAACAISGLAALFRLKQIIPAMVKVGVPPGWLVFPIGTLKTVGAAGLIIGLVGSHDVGVAASGGLILFFVCAVYTHLLAGDHSLQLVFATAFLALVSASFALYLTS